MSDPTMPDPGHKTQPGVRRRRVQFAGTPTALIRDPNISAGARTLYGILDSFAGSHDEAPWPSQATLAHHLGVTDRSVRNYQKELTEAGWLTVEHRSGTSSLYWLEEVPRNPTTGGIGSPPPGGSEPGFRQPRTTYPEPTNKTSTDVETSPAPPPAKEYPDEVHMLCTVLADAVEAHRGGERPKVSAQWLKDMDLLIRRGPLGLAEPEQLGAGKVQGAIAFVFSELASPQGGNGFCWADQVRSPGALRRHYSRIRDESRKRAHSGSQRPWTASGLSEGEGWARLQTARTEARSRLYEPTKEEILDEMRRFLDEQGHGCLMSIVYQHGYSILGGSNPGGAKFQFGRLWEGRS